MSQYSTIFTLIISVIIGIVGVRAIKNRSLTISRKYSVLKAKGVAAVVLGAFLILTSVLFLLVAFSVVHIY